MSSTILIQRASCTNVSCYVQLNCGTLGLGGVSLFCLSSSVFQTTVLPTCRLPD